MASACVVLSAMRRSDTFCADDAARFRKLAKRLPEGLLVTDPGLMPRAAHTGVAFCPGGEGGGEGGTVLGSGGTMPSSPGSSPSNMSSAPPSACMSSVRRWRVQPTASPARAEPMRRPSPRQCTASARVARRWCGASRPRIRAARRQSAASCGAMEVATTAPPTASSAARRLRLRRATPTLRFASAFVSPAGRVRRGSANGGTRLRHPTSLTRRKANGMLLACTSQRAYRPA